MTNKIKCCKCDKYAVILENKKVVESKELILTTEDVSRLTSIIADKLEGFLDIGNRQLLESSISAAIKEIVVE